MQGLVTCWVPVRRPRTTSSTTGVQRNGFVVSTVHLPRDGTVNIFHPQTKLLKSETVPSDTLHGQKDPGLFWTHRFRGEVSTPKTGSEYVETKKPTKGRCAHGT